MRMCMSVHVFVYAVCDVHSCLVLQGQLGRVKLVQAMAMNCQSGA